jgi:hypothetical protein
MKWIGEDIKIAYVTAIGSNITSDNEVVEVYDMEAPTTSDNAYIVLSSIIQNNDNDKDAFSGYVTINLDITSAYSEPSRGRAQIDRILNSVLTIIHPNPRTVNLTSSNFKYLTCELVGGFDGFENGDTDSKYRIIANIQHKFQQL